MFKKLTKFIVNQMDPSKELVPVESIAHNEHFRPLCLLQKKRKSKTIFHPAPYYQWTGFKLHDVLLPGEEDGKSTESLLQPSCQYSLTKISADQADGGLSIPFEPASVDLHGGASLAKAFAIKPQKKNVSLQLLEALRERQINMNHSFIQQLQKRAINLHVVIEILEASEETVYKESTKTDGAFNVMCHITLGAKGTREDKQTIVIPKGCTLAFRTMPLCIRDGAWDLIYFPVNQGLASARLQGASKGKLGVVVKEVKHTCRIFPKLSPELLLIVFNIIKAVMRNKNLLQELSQKTEEILEQNDSYELKTESPDLKDLFSALQQISRDSRHCLLQIAEGITYVLDALHELMDDQLLLLLESLERKILSQQLNLVAHLLNHDLEGRMCNFHVDARLLSFPHEEEQMLTMELMELSGVQLQEDGSAVPRDQPFEAMAALFVALYALKLLSGSK